MPNYPGTPIPNVALVRRSFPTDHIRDVGGEVRYQLQAAGLAQRIKPGQRIAITAGSRGITNIGPITKVIVEELKKLEARPFIVPAMGSHGGATAEGQIELIAEYGVTEATMHCPILSSMDTVVLGETQYGAKVHMDKNAYNADAVIVLNRVKAHTNFRSPIESGLCKMIAVGLGKQCGAESMHASGLGANIPEAARIAIDTGKILLGVALVENAGHRTCKVVACPPEKILETDRELLRLANQLEPRVPFDQLDVLVVDRIGKDISGAGMDANVIGIWRLTGEGPFSPMYRRVVVLNVTPESHGNCVGIGMADFTTRNLVSQFDVEKVYWNAITANVPLTAKIPIALETEVTAVEVALRSAKPTGGDLEMVRIRSTMDLSEFYVTAPLLARLQGSPEYEVVRPLAPMRRDEKGNLLWD